MIVCLDDHHMESSIRNPRSLGVIPRAKIKTVKMTLVIVIGKHIFHMLRLTSSSSSSSSFSIYCLLVTILSSYDDEYIESHSE